MERLCYCQRFVRRCGTRWSTLAVLHFRAHGKKPSPDRPSMLMVCSRSWESFRYRDCGDGEPGSAGRLGVDGGTRSRIVVLAAFGEPICSLASTCGVAAPTPSSSFTGWLRHRVFVAPLIYVLGTTATA